MPSPLPNTIDSLTQLEDLLSLPTDGVIDTIRRLTGDIMVLGVAGKMGPTLARMLRRASDAAGVTRKIIGVSRFSTPGLQQQLESQNIETIQCELLDRQQLNSLPDAPNLIYMTGMKFGATGNEALTWAMNSYLSGMICEKFSKSRIVAFSTGNVYGLTSVAGGGSVETDLPKPVGEYAMSCLGRERIFQYFSRAMKIPLALIRLNYAAELRYGVLLDVAQKVMNEHPIDLSMGHLNVIWQGDANALAIRAFDLVNSPAVILNVTGSEILRVRDVAKEFGKILGKRVHLEGAEATDALLNNPQITRRLLGSPTVETNQLIRWTAEWVKRGSPTLDKPTHFEARDGKY